MNDDVLADWERELLRHPREHRVDQEIRYAALYDRFQRLKNPKHVDVYGVRPVPGFNDPQQWDWPGGEK